jgi:hypothetical protein
MAKQSIRLASLPSLRLLGLLLGLGGVWLIAFGRSAFYLVQRACLHRDCSTVPARNRWFSGLMPRV